MKTIISNPTEDKDKFWSGRPVEKRITCKEKGTFSSYHEAREWAKENGYSEGSMARTMPIGLMKGDFDISKWYNLSQKDIAGLDGVIISNDFREGQVEIIIFKK